MKSDRGSREHTRTTPEYVERHLHVLSDAELLGAVLAGGCVQEESTGLARELLGELGGLSALPGTSGAMLRHGGLRETQASALLASCELASRLARQKIPKRRPLDRTDDVARFLLLRYQQRDQEVMGALFLDIRHRLLGDQEIFRGTLCRAEVEPREILKACLLRGAAGVVVFHTHPSGDPTPSDADLLFTRRMAYAATLVGVELVDHLVLGAIGLWVSIKAQSDGETGRMQPGRAASGPPSPWTPGTRDASGLVAPPSSSMGSSFNPSVTSRASRRRWPK